MSKTDIKTLWESGTMEDWENALKAYWEMTTVEAHKELECEMDNLHQIENLNRIREMDGDQFRDFLYNKYFVWKYTASNRLTTTRNQLKKQGSDDLYIIKNSLFTIHDFLSDDIALSLINVQRIKGLGVAGGSGLLSLLFPELFGTVDQFLIDSLREVSDLREDETAEYLNRIVKENIKTEEGVFLEKILQKKAQELNEKYNTNEWTPRKIDMVLWSYGHIRGRKNNQEP